MKKILVVILGLVLVFGVLAFYLSAPQYYKESRFLMGTIIEVTAPDKKAIEVVFNKFEELNNLFSVNLPESQINRLNQQGSLKVSKETLEVIELAKYYYGLTDGAFDITVLPLLEIWGFSKKDKLDRAPSQDKINAALSLIGSDKIIIDKKNSLISFSKKGMKIDLGGIAKGFAVDQAIKELAKIGVRSALINAGGDIYCLGKKGARNWSVGIRDPNGHGVNKVLNLENDAIATSGDYERFIVIDNKTYPHIINPKTGFPVDTNVQSVSVVAESCALADVLATALFVMDEDRVKEFSKTAGVAQVLIYKR